MVEPPPTPQPWRKRHRSDLSVPTARHARLVHGKDRRTHTCRGMISSVSIVRRGAIWCDAAYYCRRFHYDLRFASSVRCSADWTLDAAPDTMSDDSGSARRTRKPQNGFIYSRSQGKMEPGYSKRMSEKMSRRIVDSDRSGKTAPFSFQPTAMKPVTAVKGINLYVVKSIRTDMLES